MPPKYRSVTERIKSNTVEDPNTGCWNWKGKLGGGRFGERPRMQIWVPGKGACTRNPTRVIYTAERGDIPEGYEIDHLCNNVVCVNPAHLEAVTPEENKRRRVQRLHESRSNR